MTLDLLVRQNFKGHSGQDLTWKIEADALTEESLKTAAYLIATGFPTINFSHIYGIPRGGVRLAHYLEQYKIKAFDAPPSLLIVDDVMTTGKSMLEAYEQFKDSFAEIHGAVIFARSMGWPGWIRPLFITGVNYSGIK